MKSLRVLYQELLAPIKDKLEAVEEEIVRELRSEVEVISRMSEYLARTKGKRIRPALFLLCSRLLGVKSDRDVALATVIEFLHTATLIHDDIIDTADTRRGRATVNSIWGNELTVLLGDYLYLRAMDIALTARRIEVLDILTEITMKLIEGEMIQLSRRGRIEITESQYMEIIQRKTAFLFSGCGRIPAVLVDAPQTSARAIGDYCFNLGIAFQIVDDILDFAGEGKVLGKPVANDLGEGTATLPVIYALGRADQQERALVQRVMKQGYTGDQERKMVLNILKKYGALDQAKNVARDYASKAIGSLEIFPSSDAKDILMALPPFVIERVY
ncbi:Polyprenyl synthetase [uncultured Desulfobacterium sp.]|uniref:Polyprenyl synthetase n=1 Tax=uncultured Desulfobacterium sp. TaxID=201089 RepID=A0A445MUG6_9BACT|nr:Polyprenyl synthetase [uncultured Desulfobacterium sp.]